jgi:hypothetical protein
VPVAQTPKFWAELSLAGRAGSAPWWRQSLKMSTYFARIFSTG